MESVISNKSKHIFPINIQSKYDIYEYRHAATILKEAFPEEYKQLIERLEEFKLTEQDITTPGGRKSPPAQRFDDTLYSLGWEEKSWNIDIRVDGQSRPSPTHQVDYYKNRVAVELEWNNKDPFYDRDLNNFRLLHQLNVISVGVIVTRSGELQEIFNQLGRGNSYGASTTHVEKLLPKIEGGGSAECPILVFAINKNCFVSA